MLIKEFLENVCNQIKYKPIREDISEELNLHLEEQKEEYIKEGFGEKTAEEKAVLNMGEAEEIGKKLNKIHKPKFDWVLFLLIGILIGFGFLTTIIKVNRSGSEGNYLEKHIMFLGVGFITCIGIYFFDYRKILNHYKLIYVISSIVLIITNLFGRRHLGIKFLWIGGMFYPNNFCMLLYIISFVGFIKNLNSKIVNISIGKYNVKLRVDILNLVVLSAISIILLKSVGTLSIIMILFLSYIIISVFYILNLSNRKIVLLKFGGAIVICGMIFIGFCIANGNIEYIQQRLAGTYNYESDLRGNGWVGKLINDTLDNSNTFSGIDYIVEDEEWYNTIKDFWASNNSFALLSIISSYGTIYASIIIGVIIMFAIKLIIDCKKIKEQQGRLLIVGFSSFILLQAIFNILMNFNLIPVTGLSLPFISYGINELLVNMIMVTFILSIYRRKDILTKIDNCKKLKIKISFE